MNHDVDAAATGDSLLLSLLLKKKKYLQEKDMAENEIF